MEQPEAFLFAVLGFWAGIDLGGSEEQVAAQGAKERRQP
jgi:hypothetical protein